MARYLRRFLIRSVLALVVAFLAVTACGNAYLVFAKKRLIAAVNGFVSPVRISAGDIYFLPPHFLYIKHAVISDGANTMISLPLLRMDVSVPHILLKKEFVLPGVKLFNPEVDAGSLERFVKAHTERVIALLASFKASCGRFSATGIRVRESVTGGLSDLVLSFREGAFSGRGSFVLPLSVFPFKELPAVQAIAETPIEWQMRGTFSSAGLSIEKCELKSRSFTGQFWGDFENSEIFAHGFVILNRSPDTGKMEVIALERKSFFLEFKDRVDRFLIRRMFKGAGVPSAERQGEMVWEDIRPDRDIDMLEVDCRLSAHFPRIDLKRVYILVNQLPLTAKGSVTIGAPASFELDVVSSMLSRETAWPYSLHGWLNGTAGNDGIRTTGEIDVNYRPSHDPSGWKEARIRFRDLECLLQPHAKMRARASSIWFLSLQNEARQSLRLDNVRLSLFLADPRYKYLGMVSAWAAGKVYASCRLDLRPESPALKAYASVRGVQSVGLQGLSDYFSHVNGAVDATARFSYPPGRLTGSLRMAKGSLQGLEFFVWLEDFFTLRGLGRIDFDALRTGFWVGKEGAGLTSLFLSSQALGVSGDYGVVDGRVNGTLALLLNRQMLEQSPKFRPILRIVGKKKPALNFVFRLSGQPRALNFFWLQSDFKKELQNAIPGFIERKIQRNVERMVNSLSE